MMLQGSNYGGLIVCIIILLGIGFVISMINFFKRKAKRAINRTINNVARQALGGVDLGDISQIISATKEASQEPEIRSISGATNVYLPKITKDFVDFHPSEATSAIKILMNEYLEIKYNEKESFEHSNIELGLETLVQKAQVRGVPHNVNIHKTAISDYHKTNEYATITYQVAIGYNINEMRKEERYKIEYTLKLAENGIADKILQCDNCGATIDSTAIEVCPYCDARIIRDTRMSWKFTSITEC